MSTLFQTLDRRGHLPLLVYHDRYRKSLLGVPLDPFRAEKILAVLASQGLLRSGMVREPRPASLQNVLRVHTVEYVNGLQDAQTLTRILGADISPAEAETVLDLQRLMVGGTIQATRLALRGGGIAVHLGGGFHHALPSKGMGFCVFNDVAIAVTRLRAKGFRSRVLVVDLDLHDGNGTREVFASDPTVHTYSVHNDDWGETAAVESTSIALGHAVADELYLDTLRNTLPRVFREFDPGLVIYLAGADVAADDHLGNWQITPQAILARDRLVASLTRKRRHPLPFVVLLAGGYGNAAWRYSTRFLSFIATGRVTEPPPDEDVALDRYRRIRRVLLDATLAGDPNEPAFELTAADLPGLQPFAVEQTRFIGLLSRHGLELLLERSGILDHLRVRGFRNLRMDVDLSEATGQTLRVICEDRGDELLIELKAHRTLRVVPGMELIAIEWLLLQNPRESFGTRRHPLPDQRHPGLGLVREVFGLLMLLCETHALDGVAFQAAHYHVAALGRRIIRCPCPKDEARIRALTEVLGRLPLAEAARALEDGRVIETRTGEAVQWEPCPMIVAVSKRLANVVSGLDYEEQVACEREKLSYLLIAS